MKPTCRIESFYTTGTHENINCFNANGFCEHCIKVFESLGCFYHYCPSQEARPALSETAFQRGTKKGNGWNAETVYSGERLQWFRNVGIWCVSVETLDRMIPIQTSIVPLCRH